MITKKQLKEDIVELILIIHEHNEILMELTKKIARLESMRQAVVKKPTKIKVKGTPGRPQKVQVKVKKPASKQPRTKDGKFAKKK